MAGLLAWSELGIATSRMALIGEQHEFNHRFVELQREFGIEPLADGQELTDDEDGELVLEDVISIPEDRAREETPSGDRFARPADPGEITRLEAELSVATDREQIAATAVQIAACYARAAAVFGWIQAGLVW